MSFKNTNNDSDTKVFIFTNHMTVENDKIYSYEFDDAIFYKLESDNNKYSYRIVVDNELYLIIFKLNLKYQLMGYIENINIIFNIYLDNKQMTDILNKKHIIILNKYDEDYYKIYSILTEYLNKEREFNPQIIPNGFQTEGIASIDLMTSSDEYIDYYESPTYYYFAKKTDDNIVKIIPKDYFFRVGLLSYVGDEYYIYKNTYSTKYSGEDVYISEVFIVDIDVTRAHSTNEYIMGNASNFRFDWTTGILVEPVINEVYVGFNKENIKKHQLDTYQDQLVVNARNTDFYGAYQPTPKYLIIDDFFALYDFAYSESYNYLHNFSYKLNINSYVSSPSDTSKKISSGFIGIAEYLASKITEELDIPYVSDAIDMIDVIWDSVNLIIGTLDANVNYYNINSTINNIADEPFNYSFYDKNTVDTIFLNIYNYLDYLRQNNAWEYQHIFSLTTDLRNRESGEIDDGKLYDPTSFRDSYIRFSFNIYDETSMITNTPIIYNYNFTDYNGWGLGNNQIDTNSSLDGLKFTVEGGAMEHVYLLNSNSTVNLFYSVPNDCYLKLLSYDGRILYSSDSRHGSCNHILMKLEDDKTYILVGGTYSKTAKEFIIERETIEHFTYPKYMNYTYNVTTEPNIKCLSYYHPFAYSIYTFTTDSYFDTEIYIYNDDFGLIGYDNDSLYVDEDSSNYNASLYQPIGDYETVYVVCRTRLVYNPGQVTLSILGW